MQFAMPSFSKLAFLLSAAGVIAGLGVSFLLTPRYVSTAVLAATADSGPHVREQLLACQQEVLSRTSLSFMIEDPRLDLYQKDRATTPLEDVVEKMRRNIRITAIERTANADTTYLPFEIQFSYSDPRQAQRVVQTIVTRFNETYVYRARAAFVKKQQPPDQIAAMEARIAVLEQRLGIAHTPAVRGNEVASEVSGTTLEVLDAPSLPASPAYPNRVAVVLAGLFSGFTLAVVIALLRRRPPPMPFPAQVA